jgi:hypothetical protein
MPSLQGSINYVTLAFQCDFSSAHVKLYNGYMRYGSSSDTTDLL